MVTKPPLIVWSSGWAEEGGDSMMSWVTFKEDGDEFSSEAAGCSLAHNLLAL